MEEYTLYMNVSIMGAGVNNKVVTLYTSAPQFFFYVYFLIIYYLLSLGSILEPIKLLFKSN